MSQGCRITGLEGPEASREPAALHVVPETDSGALQIQWSECEISEVIAVGTAASLLPIKSITRKSTNDKYGYGHEVGACTLALGKHLKDIMKGNVINSWDWLARVEEKDLLLEEPVVNGEVDAEGEAFANGNVQQPVAIG